LTGDKQGTAINIAKSCKLTTDDMVQHILNVNWRSPEDRNAEGTILGKAGAYKHNREDCVKKLEEIGKLLQTSDLSSEHTMVVDGKTLEVIFEQSSNGEENLWMYFQDIAVQMVSVTCCRVSPDMKAMVTNGVKVNHPEKPITLAIGDGANDVPMIQAAHVGIGIFGVEGRQAVQASDYAIGQFRFLQPLLLVHGRWSYIRNTYVVNYSFYKNLCFSPAQYWWAFASASSGQKFYIEAAYQLFNVTYSALPIIAYGIFEQDVNARISLRHPELYKLGRRNALFTPSAFMTWILLGLFQSIILFVSCNYAVGYGVFADGQPSGSTWVLGSTILGCVVTVINIVIALQHRLWFWLQHFFVWVCILAWWVLLAMFSQVDSAKFGPSYWGDYKMWSHMYTEPLVWFTTILAVGIALIPAFILRHLQDEPGGPYGPATSLRQEYDAEIDSKFLNCGLCGCPPCSKKPSCCGNGCVPRNTVGEDTLLDTGVKQIHSPLVDGQLKADGSTTSPMHTAESPGVSCGSPSSSKHSQGAGSTRKPLQKFI